jgi:phosphatidylglycerophosphate synthase
MLLLYFVLLGALALFTAYTRNFQRTIVELGSEVGASASGRLMTRGQWLRTLALLAGWPLAIGIGMLFVAWWKAVALAVGAFLILVPLLGSLTPRAASEHYVTRIRADLRQRIARGGRDAEELHRLLERIDQVSAGRPT